MGLLHAAQEDSDFKSTGSVSVDTTAGHFRSGYARCALQAGNGTNDGQWLAWRVFSSSSFWHTARLYGAAGVTSLTGRTLWCWRDSSNVQRLRIRTTATSFSAFQSIVFVVEKVTAAGVATQLGSSFSIPLSNATLGKIDANIVYSTSGSIVLYLSNSDGSSPISFFTYSGDVTTDGVTSLAGYDLGTAQTTGVTTPCAWSEVIVHTSSTLSMSLAYGAPSANGNTHNWTSAAASNVNPTTMNLATPDYSNTAGQIDQYTVNAIPTGSFSVRAVVVGGTSAKGTSGPSKLDWGVRTGSTDYWGSDVTQDPSNAATPSQSIWETNPNTGSAWTTSQVGNASGFNIGVKSVA